MDKDPAIKLFGQTIPLPDAQVPANSNGSVGSGGSGTSEIPQPSELMGADGETGQSDSTDNIPNPKEVQVPSWIHREATGQEEKVMKKPDKGILPCPRCHSRDTKFCYFNNYNVKQPRHFCRNCNRYWTAGGTTRNVPVNSGRRKNKHFASQYHQIILSATDVLPTFGIQPSYSSPSFSLSTGKDRTVLQFGSPEPFLQSSCGSSSLEASSFMENVMPKSMKGGLPSQGLGFGVHLQNPTYSYTVPPWIVPTNQGWNAAPNPTQMVAVPHFCTLTTPLQFMSGPSYWGCLPVSPAGSSLTDSSSNGFLISGNCSSPTSADNLISPSSLGWGERKERNFPASNMAGTGGTYKSSWSSIWSALATNLNQKKA